MKHVLKNLKHNGIFVPQYELKGFKVTIQGQTIPLTVKSEQMAVAWIRKRQSVLSPPDKVFMKNFMREFLEQLKQENPSSELLKSFASEYPQRIEDYAANDICNPNAPIHTEIDFSEIVNYVEGEKQKKTAMTQGEKKRVATERKAIREELKQKFAVAEVDGQKQEIANWTAEPSCLFAGRGDHPQRGKWKDGPNKENIILNLSPDAPNPDGWKHTWEPNKMYIAKWQDKLTGKMKYVW